jgi:hypothetical protein
VRRAAALGVLLLVAACGGASRPRIVTFAGQLPETVVPLAWLEGRWERPGGLLVYAAAGPALFGVHFGAEPDGHEVLIIEAPVRRAHLEVRPGGGAPDALVVGGHGRNFASFAGIARRVRYDRKGDRLTVTTQRGVTRYTRAEVTVAADLVEADRAWAGAAGETAVALADSRRHVVAAAIAPAGDLGFTVGFYRSADGRLRGAYGAVWQRGPSGWTLRSVTSRPMV